MNIYKFAGTVFVCACFLLSGCAVTPQIVPPSQGLFLKELCSLHAIDWQWDSVNQVVTLQKLSKQAKLMVDSKVVILDDKTVTLSEPLRRVNENIVVPPDFRTRVLDAFLPLPTAVVRKFRRVVLDPGHGGYDPGAIASGGFKEKEVTFDIASRVAAHLKKHGFDVSLTRETDKFVALDERARIAARRHADLFVSIHVNASRAKSAHGFEVYYLRDIASAHRGEQYFQKGCDELLDQFAMQKDSPVLKKIVVDMLYQNKQKESRDLAGYLSAQTSAQIGSENRGCKPSEFFVLKNTLMPAILIEVGFLSNSKEAGRLKTDAYRENIAESIAKTLINYVHR